MEFVPVCSLAHGQCRNYYCIQCKAFSCRDCALGEHLGHTECIRDFKEIILQYLNSYVKLKSESSKALRLHQKLNSSQTSPLQALVMEKIGVLRASYSFLYSSIISHRRSVIDGIKSLPYVVRLRSQFDQLRSVSDSLHRDLYVILSDLRDVWIRGGGPQAVSLLETWYGDRTALEEWRRKTALVCKRVRGIGGEVRALREMKIVTARYVSEPYFLEKMCGFAYDKDFETVIYKAHYGKPKMTEYHCISKALSSFELDGYVMPHNFGIVEVNEKLYIIGGQRKELMGINKYLNTVYLLDPATRQYVSRCGMKERRMCLSATVLMNLYIFVVGGFRNAHLLDSCERYDLARDVWVYMPPLNSAKSNCGVCTFQERLIYAFAGYVHRRDVSDIELLDLLELGGAEKWTMLDVLLKGHWEGMQNPGAIQISNLEILVFGGVHRGKRLGEDYSRGE